MSLKAKLSVVLKADDIVVAELEGDAVLWQKVLAAINHGGGEHFESNESGGDKTPQEKKNPPPGGDAIGKFAADLGLTREVVQGACEPALESPYLTLDHHCWEEMKKQTPMRGSGAYSPISIAATLLALWFRAAELGTPTQKQARDVLKTINIEDKNPSRGIKSSEWLQSRQGGLVVVNPAKISVAKRIAKAFCAGDWSGRPE